MRNSTLDHVLCCALDHIDYSRHIDRNTQIATPLRVKLVSVFLKFNGQFKPEHWLTRSLMIQLWLKRLGSGRY